MLGSGITKLWPVGAYGSTYVIKLLEYCYLNIALHLYSCTTATTFAAVVLVNSITYLIFVQQTNVL